MDDAVEVFYNELFAVIREHIPRRRRRSNCCINQPWWNNDLRRLRNRLRKARRRFFKHRSTENRNALTSIEQEYSSNQRNAFREYITKLETNAKSDPSAFWSYMKRRRQSKNIPREIRFRNVLATSAEESANLLADFFKTVFNDSPPTMTQDALNSVPAYDLHMPLLNVSVDEVFRRFLDLDPSKGPGPDGIPPLFIKQCAASLALPASIIYNRSLSSGKFPEMWKLAMITPIHKSGSLHDAENYRGISILNCFSKVLECFVHDALYTAVSSVISPHQHGFVKHRSTTTNLVSFVTSVRNCMEKNGQVDAIYVDFAKAFDKVPHLLAVEKLRKMGLPEWVTTWIHSYLTTRLAFVKVHGYSSKRFGIPSGVPQGSHLGPLLFILFINDLAALISSEKLLYADDLKIFRNILSHLDCCALQRDLDTLLRWCQINRMDVNVTKCNVIAFTRSRTPILSDYSIGLHKLSSVNTIKDLGVVMDSKANFNEHIAITTSKAFSLLGFLRRVTKSFYDVYALKTLYCAIVRSVLEYAVQVWAPYHQVQVHRIERVQRSFVRYALRRLPWNDPIRLPSYESRCMLIGLSTLSSRRTLLQRMFCFDLITNRIDCEDLLRQINFHAPRRRLRTQVLFYIAPHRTLYGRHNPLDNCCRLFNEAAEHFDFNISKTTYKNRIRSII